MTPKYKNDVNLKQQLNNLFCGIWHPLNLQLQRLLDLLVQLTTPVTNIKSRSWYSHLKHTSL